MPSYSYQVGTPLFVCDMTHLVTTKLRASLILQWFMHNPETGACSGLELGASSHAKGHLIVSIDRESPH